MKKNNEMPTIFFYFPNFLTYPFSNKFIKLLLIYYKKSLV